jgi:Rrf2 family protein
MVDTRFPVSVHIMVSLAYHADELMNSEQLAQVVKTNPTFIRKLVSRLVDAGLVESYRGKGGGIKISKSPDQISLKDIYLASLEEKPLLCAPKKPITKACPVSCSMNDILCKVIDGMEVTTQDYLSSMTLQDLLQQVT